MASSCLTCKHHKPQGKISDAPDRCWICDNYIHWEAKEVNESWANPPDAPEPYGMGAKAMYEAKLKQSYIERGLLPTPQEISVNPYENYVLDSTLIQTNSIPDPKEDPGSHYRFTYKGLKLDPERIAKVYGVTDGMQYTALKKILRLGTGHKDRVQDWKDIICAAQRALEIIEEDKE